MRSVTVGVRGDSDLDPALDLALEEAVRRRIPLVAVHCYEIASYADWPASFSPGRLTARRDAAQRTVDEALQHAVHRVPGAETVAAQTKVMQGPASDCLLKHATHSALVVVGRRGGNGLQRGVRGSVSAAVLHGSSAPVALVPHDAPSVPDRCVASRVLVGLDGSPASLTALAWAVAQAREWGSVLAPVVVSSPAGRAPAELVAGGRDLRAAVWSAVHDAGGAALETHPLLLEGAPTDVLLDQVEAEDLLVVGSRGRGGLGSLLLGSTSTAVAENASCPVVVVREGQTRRETHQRQSTRLSTR